jgi:arylsulfatase A-like enzyme
VGTVLDAIEDDNTLVILTTDHGLAFPGAKATLTDRGIGVLLIIRGPGGFTGGRVSDALVSQVDLFPTITELLGIERPEWVRGKSLLPLTRRDAGEINDAVFAEITFHAAYEPQRAVRTRRYKYIRRYERPVLANIDDSPSKDYLLAHGLAERDAPEEQLYDLVFDPNEADNIVHAEPEIAAELRARLTAWMEETGDPLLAGPIAPAPGTEYNTADQRSPSDPTRTA